MFMTRITALILITFVSGCATTHSQKITNDKQNNPFTHGNVQLTLKKGVTTQADILENFGSPNIATIDSEGLEVWTYQKTPAFIPLLRIQHIAP